MQKEQTSQSLIEREKVQFQNIQQLLLNDEEGLNKLNQNQGSEQQIQENQDGENAFSKDKISSALLNSNKIAKQQRKYYKIYRVQKTGRQINAMAISTNGQTIVTAKTQNIQIWNFNKGVLQKSQKLFGHTENVRNLYYSHNNDWFISMSKDGTFGIWEVQANEWICKQTIEKPHNEKRQILLNKEEDQLFFSDASKIIIWIKKQKWVFFQQFHGMVHQYLSLNPDCDQLACVASGAIGLWDCDARIWKFSQSVHLEQNYFLRACLIGKNDIIATSMNDGYFYRLIKSGSGKFEISQKLLLDECFDFDYYSMFPLEYCPKERLVVCRHGWEYTYVLTQNTEGNFEINKVFEGDYEDGYLSYDGKYLILAECRDKTLEIYQLRKQ